MIALKNISKKYDDTMILEDISFTCEKGDIVGLIGSSGSGKTTLLRIISGLETPDSGTIQLNNEMINDKLLCISPEKRDCSLVFQDFALFPNMTISDNIFFGKNSIKNSGLINDLIQFCNLENLLDRYPHEISGGEQQRVALVRALSIKPSLLLLDEPLSHLDSDLKQNIRNELINLFEKVKATTLFVSHDIEDAMTMANKVIVLKDGLVEQIDSPNNMYNQPISRYVAKLFGKTNIFPSRLAPKSYFKFYDRELNEDAVSIRPHQFTLLKNSDKKKNTFDGIILSKKSFGSYQEVLVHSNGLKLVMHFQNDVKLGINQKIKFFISI
tara:strand:+ start:153 stop:1133 length:981 start_codon:yes stop_codon:yes gene_type:complete